MIQLNHNKVKSSPPVIQFNTKTLIYFFYLLQLEEKESRCSYRVLHNFVKEINDDFINFKSRAATVLLYIRNNAR